MNSELDPTNLDAQLRSAADDVRAGLGDVEPPAFQPPSPAGGRVAIAALAVIAVIALGGGWLLARNQDPTPTRIDVTDTTLDSTAPTDVPSTAVPSTAVPSTGIPATSTPIATDPVALQSGLVDASDLPVSDMEQPSREEFAIEPDTGVSIRRLTDSANGVATQPVWSRTQTYNADGSLLLFYRTRDGDTPSAHIVIDVLTGELVTELNLDGRSDIENVSWDPLAPNVLVFQRGNELVDVDVRSGEMTIRAVFRECSSIGNGDSAGSTMSSTGLMGLVCDLADGGMQWLAFDRPESEMITGDSATVDAAPIPSVSGEFVAVLDNQKILVFDSSLDLLDTVAIEASSFTMAQDRTGNDVLVAAVYGGATPEGTVVIVTLATGAVDVIVGPDSGYPYPPTGTRLSTAATDAPHLVAIATTVESSDGGVLENEIMLLEIDGADSVLHRLAHHRSSGGDIGSWPGTTMVAVNPDGSSILFSSDWGTGAIDTYEIDRTR